MKKQILVIGGGDTFTTYEEYVSSLRAAIITLEDLRRPKLWSHTLDMALPEYEIIRADMPNDRNAKYEEWKIWFEKIFVLLEPESILVGHSLGGIFITKYFSERLPEKHIASIHLVAAPYNDERKEPLGDFKILQPVTALANHAKSIFLYHSMDDFVVPFNEMSKYIHDIPTAKVFTFTHRNHFLQPEFPELLENIKKSSQ